jgi:hypothetical protein
MEQQHAQIAVNNGKYAMCRNDSITERNLNMEIGLSIGDAIFYVGMAWAAVGFLFWFSQS